MKYETWQTMQSAANQAWQAMSDRERAKVYPSNRVQAMDAAPQADSEILPIPELPRESFANLPKEVRNLAARHAEQRDARLQASSAGARARAERRMAELEREIERLGYCWDKDAGFKRKVRAADTHPQSDLDFYTRCAAESTRLA